MTGSRRICSGRLSVIRIKPKKRRLTGTKVMGLPIETVRSMSKKSMIIFSSLAFCMDKSTGSFPVLSSQSTSWALPFPNASWPATFSLWSSKIFRSCVNMNYGWDSSSSQEQLSASSPFKTLRHCNLLSLLSDLSQLLPWSLEPCTLW